MLAITLPVRCCMKHLKLDMAASIETEGTLTVVWAAGA